MQFFAKNNQKKEELKQLYTAVDIGTEFVKSVVFVKNGNEIEVVGYNKTQQKESSMYAAFIISLKDVIETVDTSLGKAIFDAKENFGNVFSMPKDVIIGIAGELVSGVSIMVDAEREKPTSEITDKEIERIVQNVKQQTFNNTKAEIAEETGLKETQIQEVSTYINSVFIDGHRVTNPIGYKGEEIVYRVFSTFAPKIHIDSIEQVAKSLKLKLSQTVVEPYCLAVGLSNMREQTNDAIIIDVGGGTTDVALIKNGEIMGTKMFAIGGRVFTKRIQREMGISYSEAEKTKMEYSKGKAKPETEMKIKKPLSDDVMLWLTGLEVALEEFTDVDEYPSSIYLCGGGALLPDIQEGLLTYPWLQTLNFKKFPKVNFIFPNSVKQVLDKTKSATEPTDVTPLALARMKLEE